MHLPNGDAFCFGTHVNDVIFINTHVTSLIDK